PLSQQLAAEVRASYLFPEYKKRFEAARRQLDPTKFTIPTIPTIPTVPTISRPEWYVPCEEVMEHETKYREDVMADQEREAKEIEDAQQELAAMVRRIRETHVRQRQRIDDSLQDRYQRLRLRQQAEEYGLDPNS